jgi:hypothetical protein
MGGYGAVVVLLLGGFAALWPAIMPWPYIAVVLGFEAWLAFRISAVGSAPVTPGEAPYLFSEEEAALVGRHRFYFTYPAVCRHAASILSAIGLTALILAPWLTYKLQFVGAAITGLNLFAVAWLTRKVAPVMTLRLAASKGDRTALRALEIHDPAWEKIKSANSDSSFAARP